MLKLDRLGWTAGLTFRSFGVRFGVRSLERIARHLPPGTHHDLEADEVRAGFRRNRRLEGADIRGGLICWEWGRDDIEGREILDSHLFWTLRMPLSTDRAGWGYISLYREFGGEGLLLDVNYLSNLFQKEMAHAAERIFTKAHADWPLARVAAGAQL